jgi:hypothetical protein
METLRLFNDVYRQASVMMRVWGIFHLAFFVGSKRAKS